MKLILILNVSIKAVSQKMTTTFNSIINNITDTQVSRYVQTQFLYADFESENHFNSVAYYCNIIETQT